MDLKSSPQGSFRPRKGEKFTGEHELKFHFLFCNYITEVNYLNQNE